MTQNFSDSWSEWLLYRRHGGDSKLEQSVLADIMKYANRVLDGARLKPGMKLADIGTGDGLVAFRAIERIGPSLQVLMTDISAPLLDHARTQASMRNVSRQCEFLQGSADSLAGIADGSVDAVTTRAVLAYVARKPAALSEFHRILRPGGRLSICEPVMRDEALEVCLLKKLVDAQQQLHGPVDPFLTMLLRWRAALYPDTLEKAQETPIANYSERDLVRYAFDAGFTDIHLEFHIDMQALDMPTWDAVLNLSPHPLAPPLSIVLEKQFTPDERRFFEPRLRDLLNDGQRRFTTNRTAWLTAERP